MLHGRAGRVERWNMRMVISWASVSVWESEDMPAESGVEARVTRGPGLPAMRRGGRARSVGLGARRERPGTRLPCGRDVDVHARCKCLARGPTRLAGRHGAPAPTIAHFTFCLLHTRNLLAKSI